MSTPAQGRWRRAARRLVPWAATLMVATVYAWLFAESWIDDAMITLSYARSLAEGNGFSIVAGVPYYGFTSPLNVILLAALGSVVGFEHAIVALTGLTLTALAAVAVDLSRRLFGSTTPGLALVILIGLNPLIQSTFGLESLLGVALSISVLSALHGGHTRSAGALLGLLVLTRPDYAVLWPAALLTFPTVPRLGRPPDDPSHPLHPQRLTAWRRIITWGVPPVLAWHLFAWAALGSAVPMTLFVKQTQAPWGGQTFLTGLSLHAEKYPVELSFTLLPLLGLIGLIAVRRSDPATVLGRKAAFWGLVHYAAFSTLAVPPYHWYYVPALGLALFAAWTGWFAPLPRDRARLERLATVGLVLLSLVGWFWCASIVGWRATEVPIHTNLGTHAQYRTIGRALPRLMPSDEPLALRGEVGTLSYYSGLSVVDPFTHPGWLRLEDRSHLLREVLRWNFRYLSSGLAEPPDYCIRGRRQAALVDPARVLGSWRVGTRWIPEVDVVLFRCDAERELLR